MKSEVNEGIRIPIRQKTALSVTRGYRNITKWVGAGLPPVKTTLELKSLLINCWKTKVSQAEKVDTRKDVTNFLLEVWQIRDGNDDGT